MVVRSVTQIALLTFVASCSAEPPQREAGSTSPDTRLGDSVVRPAGPSQAATSRELPEGPQPGPLLLTPDGWGPLRIGMSRAEVVAAAGEDAQPNALGGADPERCDEFRPRNAPEGVLVMIEKGVLTRISVSRNTDISTPAGFRVGDSGAKILNEYGAQARIDAHQYREPPARYITVWRHAPSQAERRGIRYEIDSDDAVVHLRGGGGSVEYVEGCV